MVGNDAATGVVDSIELYTRVLEVGLYLLSSAKFLFIAIFEPVLRNIYDFGKE